ncbi:MAG: threonine aldolase family protein [Spirochaetales bacterium]
MNHALASDNGSGVHPKVMDAIIEANRGHAVSYGSDPWTEEALRLLRSLFGHDCEILLTFTGTGANVLGLSAVTPPIGSVLCSDCSHIATDECGAPERLLGCKLDTLPQTAGKVRPEDVHARLAHLGFQHHNQPRVLSVTQPTELGTLYTIEELTELARVCHESGLFVHMDGARLSNACAALNLEPAAVTREAGVDVLSFGLTKNGAMDAEAVIVFDPSLAGELKYQRKQQMQLASKMRFLSAQFIAMLTDELWLENAGHANAMASRLYEGVSGSSGVRVEYPVEANAVFATVDETMLARLLEQQYFYTWDPAGPVVRWMASFDTTESVIDSFVAAAKEEVLHVSGR